MSGYVRITNLPGNAQELTTPELFEEWLESAVAIALAEWRRTLNP